jgi:hypothetical protein
MTADRSKEPNFDGPGLAARRGDVPAFNNPSRNGTYIWRGGVMARQKLSIDATPLPESLGTTARPARREAGRGRHQADIARWALNAGAEAKPPSAGLWAISANSLRK